jgi:hypothetical protein
VKIKRSTRELRILDFDIENRPLSYWYDGKPTAEITAIAWSWEGEREVDYELLGANGDFDPVFLLERFCCVYDQADIVTGHYIRNHDLPIINGSLMEWGMEPLSPKLTSDTKNDLIRRDGLSMSQEALAAMYGLEAPKHHMTQQEWRDANRLLPDSFEKTRKRVVSDVIQHKQLRAALIEHGALKAPRIWRP